MLEQSVGVLFFLKQSKRKKKGPVKYIYLRVTVDGVSKEFSTKRTWNVDRWNQNFGRAEGSKENARTLNAYLDALTSQVTRAKLDLLEQGKVLTAPLLIDFLKGNISKRKVYMLMEVYADYLEVVKSLIGEDYAVVTWQRLDRIRRCIGDFILYKYGKNDIPLSSLDFAFAKDLTTWLKAIRGLSNNTTVKYFQTFKSVVIDAVKRKWIASDPFSEFKLRKKEIDVVPLNEMELSRIQNKQFSCERLNVVRDLFIFSCYTGLAYADISRLAWEHISRMPSGDRWIIIARKKTTTLSRIPLLPTARGIIYKYGCQLHYRSRKGVLPRMSNQKLNAYLKEIADLTKITKHLTFHIARHTFATTVTLANGLSLESVSAMLGHKRLAQTQHYGKIVGGRIAEEMNLLKRKLENNPERQPVYTA
ncbi:site-specific integrase [Chitinophaga horti]|uniref:Site-specific integrase n=1 Tax=Chitinophaga horti TaxID=2920382 RepID=A0ABY6J0P5_9BACT|nr:site-specific integrase [Chitinophaga horti]UYQ92212.1 site-specific integrase [Chitinophaga horti]